MTARELRLTPGQAALKINCHQAEALQFIARFGQSKPWPTQNGFIELHGFYGPRVGIKTLRERGFIQTYSARVGNARLLYRHTITDLGRAALAAHEGGEK